MITLAEVKDQLRIDPAFTDEDTFLNRLILVSQAAVETFLDRKLYIDQAALDADTDAPTTALVVNEQIRHAMLLLVGDLYENREATSDQRVSKNMTFKYLLNPYRDEVAL